MKNKLCFMLISFVSLTLLLLAPSLVNARIQYPGSPLGYVSDFAHVLTQQQTYILDRYLHNYHQATGNQVEVAIVPTIGNDTGFNYSYRLAQTWGLGQKREDKAALVLIAMKQHKIFIQSAYGLESKLTDLQCHHIIRKYMVPYFRHGDFYQGIGAGLEKITQTIDGKPFSSISSISLQPYPQSSGTGFPSIAVFFIFVIILLIILPRTGTLGSFLILNGLFGGGGFGGGFGGGGFGGGGFGGGGFGGGGGGIGGFLGGGGSFGGGGAGGSW